MYKAIIFDLDNTLLNYSKSEWESMQNTVNGHGVSQSETFDWDKFWRCFQKVNMQYWNDRNKAGHHILEVLEYSFKDTLKELKCDDSVSQVLAGQYWETFCQTCHFEEYAPDLLSYLHGSYKLAIISNGIGEAQRGRLAAGGMDHYFDRLIISDEVGYWKPDKKIFETALKQLDINHTEALFIGDSLRDDYSGSVNAGIDFCFYNPKGIPLEKGFHPAFTIKSLQEVKEILGNYTSGERETI
ncbi:YjjG family noncanonical pyrimidine nucleotidase [Lederbergia sp. NSJ-179]|uniref:YjjG family noncanonical pyrimidine nucleotidase n=1 Tax=Lederbergia sp. NSJ-179 TaxID=2931402 RepID=UPI001FD2F089|nr:YjjG family noncanonical pyrimidine nucleotidase [Lederbergia sp. NSJ-179]MCJ7839779.1 YjjG family noncanonical pyrimidine nucleotidase [Lederbergia sp. NSJ-179]